MNLITQWYNNVRQNWRDAATDEQFVKAFWANFAMCFLIYMATIQWLKYNSTRCGTVLNDPCYFILPPHDFSVYIGLCMYSVVILTVLHLVQYPHVLNRAFTGFTVLFVIRAFCIFMVPLSASPDMITLHDPFSNFMANEESISNDLFFSGHVADLSFFALVIGNKYLRRYCIAAGICLAIMLVWQRVHYTMDVVAAPFFAYFCYWAFVEKDVIWSQVLKQPEDARSSQHPAL